MMLVLTERRWRQRRARRRVITAGVAAVVAISLAACGAGDDTGNEADGMASGGKDEGLQYASCLRDQGVDVPDPKPGDQAVTQIPDGVPRAKAEAAIKACQKYAPQTHTKEEHEQFQKEALELAKCYRKNGVEVDDPKNGVFIPPQGTAQDTPAFKKATEACKEFMGNRQEVGAQ
ncbi:hypothetical protein H9Y04_44560 [Streptomyces sp. TRM66268-LWL]|uniref:Lipoprotein n=1 Tax=Streptomyces polyasparticus TaxID=2767826 RepID=A0ABR7SVP8_9ACTN|nr:hypothetical protein [Streptomyces polyasparticus]MBC9719580.1 hypothetical protein [Streptomyces polyasparticus]